MTRGMRIWSFVGVALGAMSFLTLAGSWWTWVGIVSAVGALVVGNLGKKSTIREKAVLSALAIGLAVTGAAVFILTAYLK